MNPLLAATQLVDWADERRAQDMLPFLVGRLVLASVNPIQIDFAFGDSINRPSYDGFLQTMDGAPLVPAGQSVWEIVTNQNPVSKTNNDYATRRANPGEVVPGETTFVFVTPRRWQGKAEWAAESGTRASGSMSEPLTQSIWSSGSTGATPWARRQIVRIPEGLKHL